MPACRSILVGAIIAITAVAASPAEGATPRCAVSGRAIAHVGHSRVLATSGRLVVYRVRSATWDSDWVCERGTRRRALIGHDDTFQSSDNEYGPTTTVGDLQLAGDWVLATLETGDAAFNACSKYYVQNCVGPDDSLELLNAATGARLAVAQVVVDSTDSSGDSVYVQWLRTVLSPVGAVAWLARTATGSGNRTTSVSETLRGCRFQGTGPSPSCPAQTLATGAIDAASLTFSGPTLSWTLGGQPQSATLA